MRRSERSAVVVVEDLHWADRATRDLISYLARTLRSGRVCWLGAIDPRSWIDTIPCALVAEPAPVACRRAAGGCPSGRVEVAEQLDALSGGPLPPEWVERIYRRCEGNPFYAEQLLVAGAGPARWRSVDAWRVVVGSSGGLSQQAQNVVRTVSVAGHAVSHDRLARLTGLLEPDLEGRCERRCRLAS